MSSSSHGLSARQSLLVGITLFSMFFGAGNLILPPLLGYQAGVASVPAVAGFLVTGIGLPVFGVMSCALVGDLDQLGGRVHPRFAFVFAILIYLSIGPCLAIPRTASTAYRMLVPVVAETTGAAAEGAFSPLAIAFSVLFFAAAGVLALRPGKLTRLLGKVTGPALIALIVVVVVSAVAAPLSAPQPVQAPYDRVPLLQGFITGYQTMDVLASVTFGIVIAQNIRGLGVSEDAAVAREVMRAGALMGALMALVYCGMAAVGTLLGNAAGQVSNGADVLSASATLHFGLAGTVIVAVIFLLACLNVCIGLLCCCAEFFSEKFPRVPYRAWVAGFAVFSCVVSVAGLDAILAFSVPLLNALYPVAIVLVLMGMLHRLVDRAPRVWAWVAVTAAVVSAATSLRDVLAPGAWLPFDALPLADLGFNWVVPVLAAVVAGVVHSRLVAGAAVPATR